MKQTLNILVLALLTVMSLRANAYNITLDIDNADAVTVEVDGSAAAHQTGENAYTFEHQILVNAVDGYTITGALDLDTNLDFAQLAQQQSIRIVGEVSTGMEESTSYDGHTIRITTKNLNTPKPYSLTINIDNPQGAYAKVGPSPYFDSNSNTKVALQPEAVAVSFDDNDKYLIVQAKDFMSTIYSVKIDGKDVSKDPYEMTPTWVIALSADNDGSVVDIIVNNPDVAPTYTMTAIINDLSQVKFFSKMPADISLNVKEGSNIIEFAEGDYFDVYCYDEAQSCTLDGEPIEWNGHSYVFSPKDGSVFELVFNNEDENQEPEPDATFTIDIDNVGHVAAFRDYDTYELIELTNGINTIKLTEGHDFLLSTVDQIAASTFTLDGEPVDFNGYSYIFTPKDGSNVVIRFDNGTDGIQSVSADNNTVTYNLNGVQVPHDNLPAGVYVRNGHKVLVK